jgi:hypothetical protein
MEQPCPGRWKSFCILGLWLLVPVLAVLVLLMADTIPEMATEKKKDPQADVEGIGNELKSYRKGKKTKHPSIVEMNSIWDAIETMKFDLSEWWKGE